MTRTLAAVVACLALLGLPGCSKPPPGLSGSNAFKLKDPVWVTYGWSKGRMVYVVSRDYETSGFGEYWPNGNLKYWLEHHGYDPEDVAACQKLFEAAKRTDRVLSDQECHRLLKA